jgi:hypothetical protein
VVAISCCLSSRTVHALLRQGEGPLPRQGEGQEGRKRLGQQPSHVTSGSARYKANIFATSRMNGGIAKMFTKATSLEIRARDEDVKTYVDERMKTLQSDILDDATRNKIRKMVVGATDGM